MKFEVNVQGTRGAKIEGHAACLSSNSLRFRWIQLHGQLLNATFQAFKQLSPYICHGGPHAALWRCCRLARFRRTCVQRSRNKEDSPRPHAVKTSHKNPLHAYAEQDQMPLPCKTKEAAAASEKHKAIGAYQETELVKVALCSDQPMEQGVSFRLEESAHAAMRFEVAPGVMETRPVTFAGATSGRVHDAVSTPFW